MTRAEYVFYKYAQNTNGNTTVVTNDNASNKSKDKRMPINVNAAAYDKIIEDAGPNYDWNQFGANDDLKIDLTGFADEQNVDQNSPFAVKDKTGKIDQKASNETVARGRNQEWLRGFQEHLANKGKLDKSVLEAQGPNRFDAMITNNIAAADPNSRTPGSGVGRGVVAKVSKKTIDSNGQPSYITNHYAGDNINYGGDTFNEAPQDVTDVTGMSPIGDAASHIWSKLKSGTNVPAALGTALAGNTLFPSIFGRGQNSSGATGVERTLYPSLLGGFTANAIQNPYEHFSPETGIIGTYNRIANRLAEEEKSTARPGVGQVTDVGGLKTSFNAIARGAKDVFDLGWANRLGISAGLTANRFLSDANINPAEQYKGTKGGKAWWNTLYGLGGAGLQEGLRYGLDALDWAPTKASGGKGLSISPTTIQTPSMNSYQPLDPSKFGAGLKFSYNF